MKITTEQAEALHEQITAHARWAGVVVTRLEARGGVAGDLLYDAAVRVRLALAEFCELAGYAAQAEAVGGSEVGRQKAPGNEA